MRYSYTKLKLSVGILFLAGALTICTAAYAEEIIHNVSVSASSDNGFEESTLKIKTLINGEVVEDYEETSTAGDVSYTSKFNNNNVYLETSLKALATASAEETYNTLQQLLRLLEQLTTMLQSQSLGE